MENIVEIKGLNISFHTQKGVIRAIRDLDLAIPKGKTLALVGESGCGKSVTAASIMQLIPTPPGKIEGGSILFEGQDLLKLNKNQIRSIRGDRISMIFQEPMTSLNPVFRIGDQIAEVFITHHNMKKKEALEKAAHMLDLVKIPSPKKRLRDYPHQLSGGMRQRVMIAMALSSPNPGLLIADEPTTALDVTIQAQILTLIKDLQDRIHMSVLLITHDMGVVAETADYVSVMYAGRKVEAGDVGSLFNNPMHPYTVGLLNSMPSNEKYATMNRLEAIDGSVPELHTLKEGCPFANRCEFASDQCNKAFPEVKHSHEHHQVFCYHSDELQKSLSGSAAK